jgi:tetratricopeptide (TPR) repeat protein
MSALSWMTDASFSVRLTTALVHFLWQGCCGGVLVIAGGACLRRASANRRYTFNVVILLLMALCLPATFSLLESPPADATGMPPRQVAASSSTDHRLPAVASAHPLANGAAREIAGADSRFAESSAAESSSVKLLKDIPGIDERPEMGFLSNLLDRTGGALQFVAPWVTSLYFVCVALILCRLFRGVQGGQRLRAATRLIEDAALLEMMRQQARRLGFRFTPKIGWCEQLTVPVVVGIIQPMILLPIAVVSGLTPSQLQALLLHELAHIRRFDPIVNVAQRVIEAILFFHPVVWFVSRRISFERELAADDVVLATGLDRPVYADALVRMAELSYRITGPGIGGRVGQNVALIGASGACPSDFRRRVLRLLNVRDQAPFRMTRTDMRATIVAGFSLCACLLVLLFQSGLASRTTSELASAQNSDQETASNAADPDTTEPQTPASPSGPTSRLLAQNVNTPPDKDPVDGASTPHAMQNIANLPGGLSVEFVGITKNTAPAKEGWRPDGLPLGPDVGYWKSTNVLYDKNISSNYEENGPHPEPDSDAIDFLFRIRGLKAQPSLTFDLPANGWSFSNLAVKDPYEFRISAHRRGPPGPGARHTMPDDELHVGLTEEPWGRYVKISPDGTVINPVQLDERHADTYKLIEVLGTKSNPRVPTGTAILMRLPQLQGDPNNPLHRYSFDFRAVDTDGKDHWATEWSGRGIERTPWKEAQWGLALPLPAGKTLLNYEFRVRPYRHWVTFKGLRLEPGKASNVTVSVKSLPVKDQEPLKGGQAKTTQSGIEAEAQSILKRIAETDPLRKADAIMGMARIQDRKGNRDMANRMLELAVKITRDSDVIGADSAGMPKSWSHAGMLMYASQLAGQLQGIPAAQEIADQIVVPHYRVMALCTIADMQGTAKDLTAAKKSLAIALELAQQVPDIQDELQKRFANHRVHRVSSFESVVDGYRKLGDTTSALATIELLAKRDRPDDCWGAFHKLLISQILSGNEEDRKRIVAALVHMDEASRKTTEGGALAAARIERSAEMTAAEELFRMGDLTRAEKLVTKLLQGESVDDDDWRLDAINTHLAIRRLQDSTNVNAPLQESDFKHQRSFLKYTALYGRELARKKERTRAMKVFNTVVAAARELPADNQPADALIFAAQGYAIIGSDLQALSTAELIKPVPDSYVTPFDMDFYGLPYQPVSCRATALALIAKVQLDREAVDEALNTLKKIPIGTAPDGKAESWYLERVKAHALADVANFLRRKGKIDQARHLTQSAETSEMRTTIVSLQQD